MEDYARVVHREQPRRTLLSFSLESCAGHGFRKIHPRNLTCGTTLSIRFAEHRRKSFVASFLNKHLWIAKRFAIIRQPIWYLVLYCTCFRSSWSSCFDFYFDVPVNRPSALLTTRRERLAYCSECPQSAVD